MSDKQTVERRIVDFLKDKGGGTVDEVAAAVKVSRTSAHKYLAGLAGEGKVKREPGGREGRRKLPDVFSVAEKKSSAKPKKTSAGSRNGRLGPGELDGHVLAYMREHRDDAPHSPSAVAKGIERSAGAVANSLARMEGERVRLVQPRPRRYELIEAAEK